MAKMMFDYVTSSNAPVALAQKHNKEIENIEDCIDDDMHCIIDSPVDEKVLEESSDHIADALRNNDLDKHYCLRAELREAVEDFLGDYQNAMKDTERWIGALDSPKNSPNGALDSISDYKDDISVIKYWVKKYESNPDNLGLLINL